MAHRLAPQASAELDDIWLDIARYRHHRTRRPRGRYHHAPFSPARRPSAHRPGAQRLAPGLRGFPVDTYIILYRIEGEDVLILHVLDGRRDIAALV